MSNNIEQGATPDATTAQATTPTVTVNNPTTPQGNPGATPTIQPDTAAQITTLTNERDSANARIKELNDENKNYRLLAKFCEANGIKPEELKTRLESGDVAIKETTTRKKSEELKKAASAPKTGIDSELLASLAGAQDVDYSTEGEGANEEGFVSFKDGDKTVKKPLLEWAGEKYPALKDRLKAVPVASVPRVARVGKGAPMGGGKAPSLAEQIREEEELKKKRAGVGMNGKERVPLSQRLGRTR